MFLKTIESTDIYGNKVLISGEEVIKNYEKVLVDFMTTRFFWIFKDKEKKINKKDIKSCAKAATKKILSSVDFSIDPKDKLTPLEKEIYSYYKFNNFYFMEI